MPGEKPGGEDADASKLPAVRAATEVTPATSGGASSAVTLLSQAQDRLILYSTNSYIKWDLNEKFLGYHHVWCSRYFDGGTAPATDPAHANPATSNPKDILHDLRDGSGKATGMYDADNAKIKAQKAMLLALAADLWVDHEELTEEEGKEWETVVHRAQHIDYRPLLYVIPTESLSPDRVVRVDAEGTANPFGNEYKIFDLRASEFDHIEF